MENITRHNVMFGDVWLCSGQSNMEMGIALSHNGQQEVAAANYPLLRLFTVPRSTAMTPQTSLSGEWLVCNPSNIIKNGQGVWPINQPGFTAVGYFFGRKLQQELGIPIGLIQCLWGGTVIEAWMSESALGTVPD